MYATHLYTLPPPYQNFAYARNFWRGGTRAPGARVPGARVPGARVPGARVPGLRDLVIRGID